MRINAYLDDEAQQQINHLTQATGRSVRHVVREGVVLCDTQTKAQQGGPRRLLAMIGQGDSGHSGHSDTASDYKQLLADSWTAKHGLAR